MKSVDLVVLSPPNLGPYHPARFKALISHLSEVAVILVPGKGHYRPWKAVTLDSVKVHTLEGTGNASARGQVRSLIALLKQLRPRAVLCVGYAHPLLRAGARWAKRARIASIVISVSTWEDHRRSKPKELAKRLLVHNLYDAAFVSGHRAAQYLSRLGMSGLPMWRGNNVVDNSHFQVRSTRSQSGIKEVSPSYFLSVVRLSSEKNIHGLIESYARYRVLGGRWDLHIAGTGPEEADLKRRVPADISQHIQWLGWVQYDQLPRIYAQAGCFVLPSTSEPWGLVVNEAMAVGLPVLVSWKCGCVPELCWRGINGHDFDPCDVEELARLMLRISSGREDLEAMGEASRRIIANFTPETWARALSDCVLTTIDRVQQKRNR